MTTKDELVESAKALYDAEQNHQYLGMLNTAERTHEERVEMDVQYKLSQENVRRKQVIYNSLLSKYTGEL
jgi:hypothetical protein